MGYTHYWNYEKRCTAKQWEKLTVVVKTMMELTDVPVQYESDVDKEACVTDSLIRFNGVGGNGHETFILHRAPKPDWNFCKTAAKPYDDLVVGCLIAAEDLLKGFTWSSDGDEEDHAVGKAMYDAALVTLKHSGDK